MRAFLHVSLYPEVWLRIAVAQCENIFDGSHAPCRAVGVLDKADHMPSFFMCDWLPDTKKCPAASLPLIETAL